MLIFRLLKLFNPFLVFFYTIGLLIFFTVIHTILWCSLDYAMNKSFCFEETLTNGESLSFYLFVGVTLATCGIFVYSIHGLFFSKKEILKNLEDSPLSPKFEIVASPVTVEELKLDNIVELLEDPEIAKAQALAEHFKCVKYEVDHKAAYKTITRTLVDYVSPDLLQRILGEIGTSHTIIKNYSMRFVRGNEDFIDDADKIYRRFTRFKDEVPSFSHEEHFGDWHYASSMLDRHENSITLLMLAFINKPTEWINGEPEALWDLQVWQQYMFKCHKNFYGAADAISYAEQLIQMYLTRPECFGKIEPVWVEEEVVVYSPSIKVIYLWDEIVKATRLKQSLLVRTEEEGTIVSSNIETESINKITVLEQPELVPNLDVLETGEQPSSLFTDSLNILSSFTKYLISFFW